MELKTKFNIGDEVYYIDRSRNSGVIIDRYVIDDLKIYERFDEITFEYNIHSCKMAQDRHSVFDNNIYPLTDIDKVLEDVKKELEKGEK